MRMVHRLALPCLLGACAVGTPTRTPQKIIDEYLQAQGGAAAVARIRTETIAGNLTEESTGKTGSWSLITRAPDRFYTEIIAGPDRTVEAYNGMSAWGQDSPEGAHTLTGDAAVQTEAAARYWNERLADVKKSKLNLQFMGIEKVRGRDTWHIRVSSGPSMTRELYFDAGTHLIAREVLPNAQLDYDDYRPVQGIQTPYRIELRRGGRAYKINVTRAEFDPVVDDSVFNFPRSSTTPLPDIATLIREVTKNQKAIDELQKQYTCHVTEEQESTDSKNRIRSTTIREYEVFNIGGEEVRRLLVKDGEPLAGNERKKEDDRFNKEFEKYTKQAAEATRDSKKQAQQEAKDDAQISDFLRVVRFTNARRERFHGQDVIAVDFGPNPDYKPRKTIENVIHRMAGVIWIDEQARDVARLEAHFDANVRIGGGVVASLDKGSSFVFEQARVNNEVWLPTYDEVHLGGRFLVLKVKANQIDRYTDYKKFHADSTFVPDPN
jgi:hypothetical protein